MSGRLRPGFCVVGGVVPVSIRDFLDSIVEEREYDSRSILIARILQDFCERQPGFTLNSTEEV